MQYDSLLQVLMQRPTVALPARTVFSAVLVLVAAIAGCTDAGPVDPRIASLHPNALIVCDPSNPDCNDPKPGPGGGINPNDSYVVGDVTVHSSTTVTLAGGIYDPVTGQSTTTFAESAPDEHIHVAAGYSTSGVTIVNTSFTDTVDPNTSSSIQVTEADLNSDNLTESNSASQLMADQQPSDATAETPMDIVGSTRNGDVTAGMIVDLTDTTSVHSNAMVAGGATAQPTSRRTLARAAVEAERTGPQMITVDGRQLKVELTKQQQLQVTDVSSSGAALMTSSGAGQMRGGVRHSRLFKRFRNTWLLSEVHTELDDDNGKRKLHQEHVMTLHRMRVLRNPSRDSLRAAARPSTEWMPVASGGGGIKPMMVACGDECNGGGYVNPGPQPLGSDLGCAQDVAGQVNASGTVNLLYQHGIWSNATSWCAMDPYLRSRFLVHDEIRHSLNSRDYYENQATDLQSRFGTDVASYPGAYVFIGHSNGGIVSRLTAQRMGGSGVAGVITVSSPQDGVPLASVGREALAAALALPFLGSNFACNLVSHLVCTVAQHLGDNAAADGLLAILAPVIIHASSPVMDEMTVHNSFYSNLNYGSEPFPRAAVIDKSWDKWTEWRLYGDFHCAMYSECDGRHVVARADRTYHRYLKCAVIGGIFSFFIPGAGAVAEVCGSSAAQMKGYDLLYKRLSVGHDSGDGIVPVGSQRYPNLDSGGQFYVGDSDSHLGVTSSTAQTGPQIALAINKRVGVPFAQ